MPEGFARVAAVSVPVHLGDVQANVNEIAAAMEKLSQKGVQAAVFLTVFKDIYVSWLNPCFCILALYSAQKVLHRPLTVGNRFR